MAEQQVCPTCGREYVLLAGDPWFRCPADAGILQPIIPGALVGEFRRWLLDERVFSENTANAYAASARMLMQGLAKIGSDPLACSEQQVHFAIRGFPRKPSSRNRHVAGVVSFFKFLKTSGVRTDNPALELPRARERRGLPRPYEDDEALLYMKAALSLGRAYWAFACLVILAGLRISEICNLAWRDVGSTDLRVTGKGEKERPIPTDSLLAEALRGWRQECPSKEWVFPSNRSSRRGQPIRRQTGALMHRKILATAGLPEIGYGPHRGRHTFATTALEEKGDLRAVQELLGHSSPATTAVYTLVRPKKLAEVVAAVGKRYRDI